MIIRLVTVVTIVAVFAIFVADWSPGVEVQGFTELQDATDDDPSGGFPEVVVTDDTRTKNLILNK